jgi:hypothetical protein
MQDGREYCPECNGSTSPSPLDVRCRSHELAFVRSRLDALRRGIAWIASGGQPLTADTLRRLLEGDARHDAAGTAEKLLGEREELLALFREACDEIEHEFGSSREDFLKRAEPFLDPNRPRWE